MPITNVKLYMPDGVTECTDYYFDEPTGSPALTERSVIAKWTGGTQPFTLEYSLDAGSSYESPVIASGITTNEYEWFLDETEYAAIMQATHNNTVRIKVTDSGENGASVDYNFNKISFTAVKPNYDITYPGGSDPEGDSAASHTAKYHLYDGFNIVWDQIYESDTATIDIYLVNVGSGVETKIDTVPIGIGNLPWCMGTYKLEAGSPLMNESSGPMLWKIKIAATEANHLSNYYYSTPFAVTSNPIDETYLGSSTADMHRARLDTFGRVAGEKGQILDEFTVLAQFEAGDGIKITQRDKDGKRVGADGTASSGPGDSVDYKKAYNLVVEINPDELPIPRSPRAIQNVFTLSPSNVVSSWQGGAEYYGTMYYFDIQHNWNLGDPLDSNYVKKQTKNSFHLEVQHIIDKDDDYPTGTNWNGDSEENFSMPQWEATDGDTIRVYVVKKGGTYAGQLPKDKVDAAELSDYDFEYRLVEVIPNPPVV